MLDDAVAQVAQGRAQSVEEHIVHIKAAHLEHQLKGLQHQAEDEAEHHRIIPLFAPPADNGEEEAKRYESRHIAYDIDHEQCESQHIIVPEIPFDLLKEHQIILVSSVCIHAPEGF